MPSAPRQNSQKQIRFVASHHEHLKSNESLLEDPDDDVPSLWEDC